MSGILILGTSTSFGQSPPGAGPQIAFVDALLPVDGDDEKDPGYSTYKAGYDLILDDKWGEAMEKFGEVKSKFPKSSYVDDAAYWSAYAQKRLDRDKGIAAYELFIKQYPESPYLDDAVADMNDNMNFIVTPGASNVRVKTAPGAYAFSYGSSVRSSERSMRQAERAMRDVDRELRRSGVSTPRPPAWTFGEKSKKKLDPQTRLKLDALYALGELENDKEAFTTLKDVALDKAQPEVMRIAAIESLEDFHKFDVLPILLDVAKSDAGDELQIIAIHSIADLGTDKNKSTDALISLFNTSKKEKHQQSTLYAIADIGNDKAVDFLVKVATTNDNYELRSDAVYYLGNIGNAKSRAALQQILRSK